MNKIYRSIWNESLGVWVAASEICSSASSPSAATSTTYFSKTGTTFANVHGPNTTHWHFSFSCIQPPADQVKTSFLSCFFKPAGFLLSGLALLVAPVYANNICGDLPANNQIICNADNSPVTDTSNMPSIIYNGPALLTVDGTQTPIQLDGIVSVRSSGTDPVSIDIKGKVTQKLLYTSQSVAIGQYESYTVPHSIHINLGSGVKLDNYYLSPTGVFYNVAAKVDNHQIGISSAAEINSLASNPIDSISSPMFHAGLLAYDATGGDKSNIEVINTGKITLTSEGGKGGKSAGIFALAEGLGSPNQVKVSNSGSILLKNPVASDFLTGAGIWASNNGTGGVSVQNTGTISSSGNWRDLFYGINVLTKDGDVQIDSGNINLSHIGPARGVQATSSQHIAVNVTGNIVAHGEANTSIGVYLEGVPIGKEPSGTYEVYLAPGKKISSTGAGMGIAVPLGGRIELAAGSVITNPTQNPEQYAIYTNSGKDVINSQAQIVGIIDTSLGADEIYLKAGILNGSIAMGEQDDLLVLSGSFDASKVSNFDGQDGIDTFELKGVVANLTGSAINNWESLKLSENADLTLTGGELVLTSGLTNNSMAKGLEIDRTSTLRIPKNFIMTGNVEHAGTINLRSTNVGHTLQINGNYVGNGGTLLLNAKLAGDNSPTDKLIVNGNTSGITVLKVNNVGGLGSATRNGIQVVEVTGNSNADFVLNLPVQAGLWEYLLNKKGKNWYLDSSYNPDGYVKPQPDDNNTKDNEYSEDNSDSNSNSNNQVSNSSSSANTAKIYRPGISAYVVSQNLIHEMLSASTGTLHQRLGEQYQAHIAACFPDQSSPFLFPKDGAWGRYTASTLDLNGKRQFDLQSDIYSVQFGKDLHRSYQPEDLSRRHYGVLLNLASAKAEVANPARAFANLATLTGEIQTRQIGVGAYYTQYQKNGGYLDGVVQFNQLLADYKDIYGGKSSQNANSWSASLEWGMPQKIGRTNWLFEPQAQLQYHFTQHQSFQDGISEISSYNSHSARVRLGGRFTWNSKPELPASEKDTMPVKTFYLSSSLVQEVLQSSKVRVSSYPVEGENLEDPWLELVVGGQVPLRDHLYLFGQVQAQKNLGGPKRSGLSANIGLRYSW